MKEDSKIEIDKIKKSIISTSMPPISYLETKFKINDSIKVAGTDIVAFIAAILIDSEGIQYKIVYWDDKTRKVEWILESEIEPSHEG